MLFSMLLRSEMRTQIEEINTEKRKCTMLYENRKLKVNTSIGRRYFDSEVESNNVEIGTVNRFCHELIFA